MVNIPTRIKPFLRNLGLSANNEDIIYNMGTPNNQDLVPIMMLFSVLGAFAKTNRI